MVPKQMGGVSKDDRGGVPYLAQATRWGGLPGERDGEESQVGWRGGRPCDPVQGPRGIPLALGKVPQDKGGPSLRGA